MREGGWTLEGTEIAPYGAWMERNALRKLFYNCVLRRDECFLAIAETESEDIARATGNPKYETDRIFCWLVPYGEKAARSLYRRGSEAVQLIVV